MHMNAQTHFRLQIFASDLATVHFHHLKGTEGNFPGSFAEHVSPVVPGAWQGAGRHAEFEKPFAAEVHRLHGVSDRDVLSAQATTASAENAVWWHLAGAGAADVAGNVLWRLRQTASSIVIRGKPERSFFLRNSLILCFYCRSSVCSSFSHASDAIWKRTCRSSSRISSPTCATPFSTRAHRLRPFDALFCSWSSFRLRNGSCPATPFFITTRHRSNPRNDSKKVKKSRGKHDFHGQFN